MVEGYVHYVMAKYARASNSSFLKFVDRVVTNYTKWKKLRGLWKHAVENVLQDLSNVYEKEKSNSDETKRREERALREARTEVQKRALYSRLVTEVMVVHVTPYYSAWFLDVGGVSLRVI